MSIDVQCCYVSMAKVTLDCPNVDTITVYTAFQPPYKSERTYVFPVYNHERLWKQTFKANDFIIQKKYYKHVLYKHYIQVQNYKYKTTNWLKTTKLLSIKYHVKKCVVQIFPLSLFSSFFGKLLESSTHTKVAIFVLLKVIVQLSCSTSPFLLPPTNSSSVPSSPSLAPLVKAPLTIAHIPYRSRNLWRGRFTAITGNT